MNERAPQLPELIQNNYVVRDGEHELGVAEQQGRPYSREHPHPVNYFSKPHEKTHGIIYRETELGGKPFVVAERYPGREVSSSTEPPADAAPDKDSSGGGRPSSPTSSVSLYNQPNSNWRARQERGPAGKGQANSGSPTLPKAVPTLNQYDYPIGPRLPEWLREYPEERVRELAFALDEYMDLAAKREQSIIAPRTTKGRVEAARKRYEALRNNAKAWNYEKMDDLDLSARQQVAISRLEDHADAGLVGRGIKMEGERLAEPRGLLAKRRAKFYDWWARQGGGDKFFSKHRLVGNAKKAAVMGAVGLPIGVAAGLAGVFVAGPLAGAAGAALVSRGVARGLMSGHVARKAAGKTVAAEQYESRLRAQRQQINEIYATADPSHTAPHEITNVYARGTEKGINRNRLRMLGSAVIGAATALGGAYLGELAHGALWGTGHQVATPKPSHPVVPERHHPPVKPHHHHRLRHHRRPTVLKHGPEGRAFQVKYGAGIINEISDYAHKHHYQINPEKAYRIYENLHGQFGRDIIKLNGSEPSTYLYKLSDGTYDVRLTHPGTGHWYPHVEAALRHLLAEKSDD